jgi:hypothetical protein
MEPIKTGQSELSPITDIVEITPAPVAEVNTVFEGFKNSLVYTDTSVQEEIERIQGISEPLVQRTPHEVDIEQVTENSLIQAILQTDKDTYEIQYLKERIDAEDSSALVPYIRLLENIEIVDRMNFAAIEEQNVDRNLLNKIWDGLDYFVVRGFTIGLYEDIVRDSEAFGKDVRTALLNMTPAEFEQFYEGVVEGYKQEGVFTSQNLNAIERRAVQSKNFGFDPDADAAQALGILDVGLTLFPLFKAAKLRGLRGTSPLEQAASTPKQHQKLAQAAVNQSGKQSGAAITAAGPQKFNTKQLPATNAAPLTNIMQKNSIVQQFAGGLRRSFTPAELANKVSSRVSNLTRKINNSVLRESFEESAPNVFNSTISVGLPSGKPFANKGLAAAALKRIRDKAPDAEAVIEDFAPGSTEKVLTFRQNITQKSVTTSDISVPETNLASSTLFRFVGSSRFNDDKYLASIAAFNEGQVASFAKRMEKEFNSSLGKLDNKEQFTLSQVIEKLWNGNDAGLKRWYSDIELETNYKALHPDGLDITPRVQTAYNTLKDTSDAAAVFTALPRLKRAVEQGYLRLTSTVWKNKLLGRKVESTENANDPIFDLRTGSFVPASDRSNTTIYRISEPVQFKNRKIKYVANPTDKKLPVLDDVMGYNAGPRRQNPDARFFVTAGGSGEKALFSAFTRKEALAGLEEIKAIQKSMINGTFNDAFVQANNKFNPSIQTAQDAFDYFADKGISRDTLLSMRERDGIIKDADLDLFVNNTYGDYISSRTRGDVIDEYGGNKTYNVSPSQAIAEQLGSSAYGIAFNGVTQRSKAAFARLVEENINTDLVSLPRGTNLNDYEQLFRVAEITGRGPQAERLRAFRQAILNRSNNTTQFDNFMERMGDQFIDFVFDTTGKRVRGKKDSIQDNLLTFNFHSAMGMFNVSQLFMQGFQALTIAAISPVYGGRSAGAAIPLMNAVEFFHDAATLDRVTSTIGKITGLDKEALVESARYIRTSGRDIIDGTAMEKGTPASFGFKDFSERGFVSSAANRLGSVVNQVAHVGLLPFRKGEQLARRTAIITAHAEAKDAFSKKGHVLFGRSFKDDFTQSWITDREQALTLNMNTTGQSFVQKGLLKIPTQWLSYSMRVFENLVSGRQFTIAERTRMAMLLGPMMGLGYMGGDAAVQHITEVSGGEPGDDAYKLLKFGVIDGMLNYLGFDLSVSSRVSYPAGFYDLMDKINDTPAELVAGPAATVAGGTVAAVYDAIGSLVNGRDTLFTEDVITALRGIKGFDNAALAAGVLKHGQIRSRNGTIYDWEMDVGDAAVLASGFRPDLYNQILEEKNFLYSEEKEVRERRKYYNKRVDTAFRLLNSTEEAEFNRGISMWYEINDELNLDTTIPESMKAKIRKSVLTRPDNQFTNTVERLMTLDREFEARALINELEKQ